MALAFIIVNLGISCAFCTAPIPQESAAGLEGEMLLTHCLLAEWTMNDLKACWDNKVLDRIHPMLRTECAMEIQQRIIGWTMNQLIECRDNDPVLGRKCGNMIQRRIARCNTNGTELVFEPSNNAYQVMLEPPRNSPEEINPGSRGPGRTIGIKHDCPSPLCFDGDTTPILVQMKVRWWRRQAFFLLSSDSTIIQCDRSNFAGNRGLDAEHKGYLQWRNLRVTDIQIVARDCSKEIPETCLPDYW